MKTSKNTIAAVAIALAFTFTGITAQAQLIASATPDETATATSPTTNTNSVVTTYSRPLAFEASMHPILNGEKIQLRYGKMAGSMMVITLLDAQNNELSTNHLDKSVKGFFAQNFDIKALSDGMYKFVLQNGGEKIVKKFEVKSNSSRAIVVE